MVNEGDRKRVSATVIAFQEAGSIGRTLESLRWADEVVVMDSGSSDGTVDIALRYTDRVLHRGWTGYADQKNAVADAARWDWVFSLDADEVCSTELASEISRWWKPGSDGGRGYLIPRLTRFMGRWIRHTDWSPDHQLRLYDRTCGRWGGGRVHESVKVSGPVGRMAGRIMHYSYDDMGDYLKKLETYTRLSALDMRDRGRRPSFCKIALSPAAAFLKSYVLKRGFLDGLPGLVVGGLSAVSAFVRQVRLLELVRQQSGGAGDPGVKGG